MNNPNLFETMLADSIAQQFSAWEQEAGQRAQQEQRPEVHDIHLRNAIRREIRTHMSAFLMDFLEVSKRADMYRAENDKLRRRLIEIDATTTAKEA